MPTSGTSYVLLREVGQPSRSIHTFAAARYRRVRRRPEVALLGIVDADRQKLTWLPPNLAGCRARVRIEANRVGDRYRLELNADDGARFVPQIPLGRLSQLTENFEVALWGRSSTSYTIQVVRMDQDETEDDADGQIVASVRFPVEKTAD